MEIFLQVKAGVLEFIKSIWIAPLLFVVRKDAEVKILYWINKARHDANHRFSPTFPHWRVALYYRWDESICNDGCIQRVLEGQYRERKRTENHFLGHAGEFQSIYLPLDLASAPCKRSSQRWTSCWANASGSLVSSICIIWSWSEKLLSRTSSALKEFLCVWNEHEQHSMFTRASFTLRKWSI